MDEAIKELRKAFRKQKLSLYLGAGVSLKSGLPDWKKLVQMMAFKTNQNILQEYRRRPFPNYLYAISEWLIEKEADGLDVIAGRVGRSYEKSQEFNVLLRETLYASFIAKNKIQGAIPERVLSDNITLNAVLKLCLASNINTKGLNSIITYNYDNMLELALESRGTHFFQPVFEEGQNISDEHLPIYHVHGYLPHNEEEEALKDREIVLSESSYHRTSQDAYYWGNIIQMKTLASDVGLMIGISMTDRNLRRILLALKNTPVFKKNYLIYKKTEIDLEVESERMIREIRRKAEGYMDEFPDGQLKQNNEDQNNYLKQVTKLIILQREKQIVEELREFGLELIEIGDFDEIEEICTQIIE